jgi:hypothetical protein
MILDEQKVVAASSRQPNIANLRDAADLLMGVHVRIDLYGGRCGGLFSISRVYCDAGHRPHSGDAADKSSARVGIFQRLIVG